MKVGSLVECISFNSASAEYGESIPVVGGIYTVRGFTEDDECIWLEEIVNPPMDYEDGFKECSFYIDLFREIQPPMTINIEELISEPQTLEHATF